MNDWQRMKTEQEQVVLVNSKNEVIGSNGKIAAHQGKGQLHRAITVFLTNPNGEILITQRSTQKPLWPLWWDAACSTHQWPGEADASAAARRLPFELGIDVPAQNLHLEFTYEYHAVYNSEWSENEVNYIFTGVTNDEPQLNPSEVAAYEWKSPNEVAAELSQENHRFAPWFEIAFRRLYPGQ